MVAGWASLWRAWQDSNPQPLGPKPSALSIELQAQLVQKLSGEKNLGRATGFEPVISCATDRRLRPLGYARHIRPTLAPVTPGSKGLAVRAGQHKQW